MLLEGLIESVKNILDVVGCQIVYAVYNINRTKKDKKIKPIKTLFANKKDNIKEVPDGKGGTKKVRIK